jgi:hypothetical protein
MPESRGRRHKKQSKPRRRGGDPRSPALGSLAAARVAEANRQLTGILAGQAPVEILVPLLLLNLWVVHEVRAGAPPNVCVDACQILRYAFGQFGILAELAAVDLAVDAPAHGTAHYGSLDPSWDGTELDGHCILWLPDLRRFADPTIAQYAAAAALGKAPVLGRIDPTAVTNLTGPAAFTEGTQFAMPRGNGSLLYTVASQEATTTITGNPWIVQHAGDHQRAGINLASHAVDFLRQPTVSQSATRVPYPRLTALLSAIGDAPEDFDDAGNWHFLLPTPDGGPHPVRLDQVSLPAGTPRPLP